MDVYIYEVGKGDYLDLLGVTDRIIKFEVERLLCGGDRLGAVFVSGGSCERLIRSERIIEIPEVFSGLITEIKRSDGGGRIEVSAVSFSGLISRRILSEYAKGDSFMTIIEKNCGASAGEKRSFPNTFIDKAADCLFVPTDAYLKRSLSRSAAAVIGKDFRICSEIVHDGVGAKIRLYGRYAFDRSVGSGAELPIILSSEYETLGRQSYAYSETGAVSGAYIYTTERRNSDGEVGCEEWSGYFGEASGFGRCEEAYEIEPVVYYRAVPTGDSVVYKVELDYPATKAAAENMFAARYTPPSEVISASVGKGLAAALHSGEFGVGDRVTLYPDKSGDGTRRIAKIAERYENGGFTVSVDLDIIKTSYKKSIP